LKLPSVATVRRAFHMQDWTRRKVPWEDQGGGEEGGLHDYKKNNEGSSSIEQIIHDNLRGQIKHSGPLNAYFEMRRREDSYELWTKDYIFGLAGYLLERMDEMNRRSDLAFTTPPIETIILDVGAGDGRLVYFLRRAMEEIAKKENRHSKEEEQQPGLPTIIATDDGSWKAPIYDNKHIRVEQLSAIEALDKYGPKAGTTTPDQHGIAEKKKTRLIVLCSWMPPGQDWTADFRRPINTDIAAAAKDEHSDYSGKEATERLVEEYILIGEADDGTCGHNWHTWGNPDFKSEDAAPRDLNGYERVDLSDLSSLQFSRFDCERSSESVTVSFRHTR